MEYDSSRAVVLYITKSQLPSPNESKIEETKKKRSNRPQSHHLSILLGPSCAGVCNPALTFSPVAAAPGHGLDGGGGGGLCPLAACLGSLSFGNAFTWPTRCPQRSGHLASAWSYVCLASSSQKPSTRNLCWSVRCLPSTVRNKRLREPCVEMCRHPQQRPRVASNRASSRSQHRSDGPGAVTQSLGDG